MGPREQGGIKKSPLLLCEGRAERSLTMYSIVRTKQFEKSYQKLKRSGKFSKRLKNQLEIAIETLREDKKLASQFHDHQLTGELAPYRECHLQGDMLLVYKLEQEILVLVLVNIGSHAHIFEN